MQATKFLKKTASSIFKITSILKKERTCCSGRFVLIHQIVLLHNLQSRHYWNIRSHEKVQKCLILRHSKANVKHWPSGSERKKSF